MFCLGVYGQLKSSFCLSEVGFAVSFSFGISRSDCGGILKLGSVIPVDIKVSGACVPMELVDVLLQRPGMQCFCRRLEWGVPSPASLALLLVSGLHGSGCLANSGCV